MLSQLAGFGIRAGTVPRRIVRVFRDWPCRYMAGGPPVMGPAKTECMWAREGAGTARARDLPPLQEKASERGCRPTPARCTVPPSAPARGRPAGTGTCCAGSAAFWCRDGGRLQPAACRKKGDRLAAAAALPGRATMTAASASGHVAAIASSSGRHVSQRGCGPSPRLPPPPPFLPGLPDAAPAHKPADGPDRGKATVRNAARGAAMGRFFAEAGTRRSAEPPAIHLT